MTGESAAFGTAEVSRLVAAHRALEEARRVRYRGSVAVARRVAKELMEEWVKFNPLVDEIASAPELATSDTAAALLRTAATFNAGAGYSRTILRAMPRRLLEGAADATIRQLAVDYAGPSMVEEFATDLLGAADLCAEMGLKNELERVEAEMAVTVLNDSERERSLSRRALCNMVDERRSRAEGLGEKLPVGRDDPPGEGYSFSTADAAWYHELRAVLMMMHNAGIRIDESISLRLVEADIRTGLEFNRTGGFDKSGLLATFLRIIADEDEVAAWSARVNVFVAAPGLDVLDARVRSTLTEIVSGLSEDGFDRLDRCFGEVGFADSRAWLRAQRGVNSGLPAGAAPLVLPLG